MAVFSLGAALAAAALAAAAARAHVRWEYPVARSDSTGIKGPYPCGDDAFFADGDAVTELAPGSNVLSMYENVWHEGAPMRVALSMGNDDGFDQHVLLSHVPHPDNAPHLKISSNTFKLVVVLPDVKCERCALQLLSVMTDKIDDGTCCSYPTDSAYKCFSVYHTCANIKINGTAAALPAAPVSDAALTTVWTKGEGSTTAWVDVGGALALEGEYDAYHAGMCTCDATECTRTDALPTAKVKPPPLSS
eukprot:CAMPEP_0198315976 /NCGR_PEP_ID=MMETSP1450-20131203/6037_1 /TAXON_ID=753684 ORGANISM="Madagascaria erythrocladiodes, Strain CCMP3234" /NCGR_SAMPLE_ID=MMETSP1450 /ASSEMBLY_ACC=CAM_ASM_001115 /LENGTH=247 /DNA_ID=CAMNT_0044019105 /DNA_START=130 /DNA_END=870 /DNA_ORIENTATION=-